MQLVEVKWNRWLVYRNGKVILQTSNKLVAIKVIEKWLTLS